MRTALWAIVSIVTALTSSAVEGRKNKSEIDPSLLPSDRKRLWTVNNESGVFNEKNLIGGDIVSDPDLEKLFDPKLRGAFCASCRLWPVSADGYYYVPYTLDAELDSKIPSYVNFAKDIFDRFTNVRLIERTDERDYLRIFKGSGCWSYLGKIFNAQSLSIGNNCDTRETVFHELMHALGILHEHQRPDRDSHITVNEENICSSSQRNFEKETSVREGSTHYDIASVMHYSTVAFSCPYGEQTIAAGTAEGDRIIDAWRIAPSHCDISAIASSYPGPVSPATPCAHDKLPPFCRPNEKCLASSSAASCGSYCTYYCEYYAAPSSADPLCEIISLDEMAPYYLGTA